MLLESIGLVTALHDYNPGQTGLVFISICVAALLGQATNVFQERLYVKNFPTKGPEARLYAALVAAVGFPVGCFIYGWTAYRELNGRRKDRERTILRALKTSLDPFNPLPFPSAHVSIAGPIVGIVVLMTSVYHVYLAVFNYLSDAYLIYASSALAAQSFCRNMVSGFVSYM